MTGYAKLRTYRQELHEVMDAYSDCWMTGENNGQNRSGASNGQSHRNLGFLASGLVPRDVAIGILQIAVPAYNEFDYKSLSKFPEDCRFAIAREGSVCLYVVRPHHMVDMPSAAEVNADEMDLVSEAMDNFGNALWADDDNYLNTFRYWWD